MYANLRVKIGDYEAIAAYRVEIANGEFVVHEDLCDGGNRAEPGAVHRAQLADLPPTTVEASF
jgi:hypothetical protein